MVDECFTSTICTTSWTPSWWQASSISSLEPLWIQWLSFVDPTAIGSWAQPTFDTRGAAASTDVQAQ